MREHFFCILILLQQMSYSFAINTNGNSIQTYGLLYYVFFLYKMPLIGLSETIPPQ
jgi:hypothetical protein